MDFIKFEWCKGHVKFINSNDHLMLCIYTQKSLKHKLRLETIVYPGKYFILPFEHVDFLFEEMVLKLESIK